MVVLPRKRATCGFTLIELLVVLVIIALLAVLLIPGIRYAMKNADMARDLANIRSYGAGITAMANDLNQVTSSDILHYNTSIEPYVGGAKTAYALLNSKLWVKKNKAFAASKGKTLTANTRSYTLNQVLFPPMQPTSQNPNPAPWEIDATTPVQLRRVMDKPILFTGVYFDAHDGAYVWGTRNHADPVYSGIQKTDPTGSIQGRTLVLFVGGHARIVDFATENLPASGSGADPEKWWQAYSAN